MLHYKNLYFHIPLLWYSSLLENSYTIYTLTLFLLIMQIDLLLQDNVILLRLESLNEWFVLYDLSCALKFRQGIYSFFIIRHIKSNSLPYEDFIPFELHVFTKVLIFDILAGLLYLFMIYCNCCSVQNPFFIIINKIYFCLLVFPPINKIYIWFIKFKIHFMTFIMRKFKTITYKIIIFL